MIFERDFFTEANFWFLFMEDQCNYFFWNTWLVFQKRVTLPIMKTKSILLAICTTPVAFLF